MHDRDLGQLAVRGDPPLDQERHVLVVQQTDQVERAEGCGRPGTQYVEWELTLYLRDINTVSVTR